MGAAEPSLSGVNVMFVRELLLEKLGKEGLERLKAAMPADAREAYFGATSVDWVPVEYVNLMNTRAAELLEMTVMEFTTTMARVSVERTLHTVWRILLRFTSDEAIVTRTPVFFARSFNVGKLATQIQGPGMARIRLTEWPDAPQLTLVGIQMGIETVLRVAGRKQVRVNLHRTADGAEFLATWGVK
jgi:hypothetical protein